MAREHHTPCGPSYRWKSDPADDHPLPPLRLELHEVFKKNRTKKHQHHEIHQALPERSDSPAKVVAVQAALDDLVSFGLIEVHWACNPADARWAGHPTGFILQFLQQSPGQWVKYADIEKDLSTHMPGLQGDPTKMALDTLCGGSVRAGTHCVACQPVDDPVEYMAL